MSLLYDLSLLGDLQPPQDLSLLEDLLRLGDLSPPKLHVCGYHPPQRFAWGLESSLPAQHQWVFVLWYVSAPNVDCFADDHQICQPAVRLLLRASRSSRLGDFHSRPGMMTDDVIILLLSSPLLSAAELQVASPARTTATVGATAATVGGYLYFCLYLY